MDAFLSCCERAMEAQNVGRIRQRIVMWRLQTPRVRRMVESQMAMELALTDDGELIASGLIDWENFDPDKFDQFVTTLLKLIEAITKLFI